MIIVFPYMYYFLLLPNGINVSSVNSIVHSSIYCGIVDSLLYFI